MKLMIAKEIEKRQSEGFELTAPWIAAEVAGDVLTEINRPLLRLL